MSKPGEGGGTPTVTPSNPKPGDTVTVKPRPDEGYEVDNITVTDKDGKPVEVTVNPAAGIDGITAVALGLRDLKIDGQPSNVLRVGIRHPEYHGVGPHLGGRLGATTRTSPTPLRS